MKARMATALALAGSLVCGTTTASTGNELLPRCQKAVAYMDTDGKTPLDWEIGVCMGTVQGTMGTLAILSEGLPKHSGACIPDRATTGQGIRIVTKYLHDNPEKLNDQDALLILLALKQAFPCK